MGDSPSLPTTTLSSSAQQGAPGGTFLDSHLPFREELQVTGSSPLKGEQDGWRRGGRGRGFRT